MDVNFLTKVFQIIVHIMFVAQLHAARIDINHFDFNMSSVEMPKPKASRETLDELLTKNHQEHDINYNGYYANHMAHAISSLYSLGASAERLSSYYDFYAERLLPLRNKEFVINQSNWTAHITDAKAYPEYLEFFDAEVQTLGQKKALDQYFPRLLPGLVGAALHPLIHIGYGIEYNNSKVLAEGLSYASTYYFNAGELIDSVPYENSQSNQTCSHIDFLEALKLLGAKARPHRQPYSDDISGLLMKFKLEIKELLGIIDINSCSQSILNSHTNAIIHIFFGSYRQQSLDFFLAHGLTGNHAIRTILPHLNEQQQRRLLRISLLSIISLYFREGLPEFDDQVIYQFSADRNYINWDYILDKVVSCADVHVIKVVRSLLVIRNQVPISLISHELIDRCAFMMVNSVQEKADWIHGIGYLSPESK